MQSLIQVTQVLLVRFLEVHYRREKRKINSQTQTTMVKTQNRPLPVIKKTQQKKPRLKIEADSEDG